jgi:hypothetical protein
MAVVKVAMSAEQKVSCLVATTADLMVALMVVSMVEKMVEKMAAMSAY